MPLNSKIAKLIEGRFGRVNDLGDCGRLAGEITDCYRRKCREEGVSHLGMSISRNTLGRMYGFIDTPRKLSNSSLNIIAVYLGYKDGREMVLDLDEIYDVSDYAKRTGVDVKSLEKGDMVHITYEPRRDVTLTYLGDYRFTVNESVNSSLKPGDELTITHLDIGFELLASDVIRGETNLGDYRTAKCGGLTTAEII